MDKGERRRLADNLLRLMGDMTVVRLAELTGIARTTLINYRCGRTDPSAIAVAKIAKALGCTTDELLEGVAE